jgi:hypothetical protein
VFYTSLLARGKEPSKWDLPDEEDKLNELFEGVRFVIEMAVINPYMLIEILKDLSFECRKTWMQDEELYIHSPIHRLCRWDLVTFGYMGRSLPCADKYTVDIQRDEAENRFFETMHWVTNDNLLNAIKNKLRKWSERSRVNIDLETPPYSESASLITSRKIGGQARIWRDFKYIFELIGEFRDEGYTLKSEEHNFEPSGRWKDIWNISRIISWLDKPYTKHCSTCVDPWCPDVHLHYPFQLKGIPETGWRVRCASLPWPSLLFMTEIPRRAIIRGAKKDKQAGPALNDFGTVEKIVHKEYINSVDLKSATDYFPIHLQQEMAKAISSGYVGTMWEHFILSSLTFTRIVDKDYEFPQWPGIEYFIQEETIGGIPKEYEHWKNLFLHKDETRPHLADKARVHHNKWDHFFAKAGLNPKITPHIARGWAPNKANEPHKIRARAGFRLLREERGMEKTLSDLGQTFVTDDQIAIDRWTESRDYFLSSKNIQINVLLRMKEWYRKAFEKAPGKLSTNGQHMSLPLSWVILSATNTVCADLAKNRDPNLLVFTMGDDALIGSDKIDSIEQYRKNITSVGAVINIKKDLVSIKGKAVFCEYLFDRKAHRTNYWIDKPRPKIITQPRDDPSRARWLCARDKLSKYYTLTQKLIITECRIAKYRTQIDEAIRNGYDATLPPEFGGMGIKVGLPRKDYRIVLSNLDNYEAKELVRVDHQLNKISSSNPPYTYSALMGYLIWGDTEMYFSNKKEGYSTSEATQLIIDGFLPSLIYEKNFRREGYPDCSPKTVGKAMESIYRREEREIKALIQDDPNKIWLEKPITDDDLVRLVKKRHTIKVKSDRLKTLEENKLEDTRFWV